MDVFRLLEVLTVGGKLPHYIADRWSFLVALLSLSLPIGHSIVGLLLVDC